MSGLHASVWRQRLRLWLPALLFFGLNLSAFLVYRMVFAGEAVVSREAVSQAQEELDSLAARRQRLEGYLGRIEVNRSRLAELYDTAFATEEERLTQILREVKRLAREAALEPQTTTYPEESIEEYGLSKRSFVFNVEGTYFDLRKLITSLELSDQFLALEEVGLSESGGRGAGARLRISLRLSTLFAASGEDDDGTAAGSEGAT